MRITELSIQDMRRFGPANPLSVTFSENKNVAIFVGDNGNGKTTVLDAIAAQVSVFISQFPKQSAQGYSDWDVHIDNAGYMRPFLLVDTLFKVGGNSRPIRVRRYRKGMAKAPESQLKELKDCADSMMDALLRGGDVQLPVLAYYGTERGHIQAPERRRGFQQTYDRWECYTTALLPDANFKRFFAWFDLMEDEERRKKEEQRNFDFRLPVLEAVRQAIRSVLGERYSKPRIEIHPLRFVVDEVVDGGVRQLRMEQMSSGFKIMLAMVADLAARMAEANPGSSVPLLGGGIVLIDEIEQHLHPKWQRRVIGQLSATFPNVQFIVTTHSPLVLLGAGNNAEIFHLEDGRIITAPARRYSNYDVGLLLLSEVFQLPSINATEWDLLLDERKTLMVKPTLTEAETKRLKAINAQLAPIIGSGGNPEVTAIFEQLKKAVSKL